MKNLSQEVINKIVNSEHHDPFEVLGIHYIDSENKKGLVVRMFWPDLQEVYLVENKGQKKVHKMEKIDPAGLYQLTFEKRSKFFDYYFSVLNSEGSTWNIEDTYRFSPIMGEQDLHFLKEGTHYRSYDKLGANLTEAEGIEGVQFAVWAPAAKRVSVVGSFNNWDGRIHQMRTLGNGFWELFIPGLTDGDYYKYEIKTHENNLIVKPDPYAKRSEIAPKTASIVYNVDKYEWKDDKWLAERGEKNSLDSPIAIYEVHLGSWKRTLENDMLDYRAMAHELVKYVKEMGYTHIELLPITEHPFYGSWGYQVTGYFSPTSRYGSPDDFKYFVDHCHQNGIGVLLDWVPAHFPKDQAGLARFDGTALYEHADPRQGEHQDWGTYVYNYGRYEVKNFLISSALFWLDKYHLDGLRVDAVASMLYLDYSREDGQWVPNRFGGRENLEAIDFIKTFNEMVYKFFPDTMTVAEESTAWPAVSRPLYTGGLGFGFKWNMGWMHDILEYMSKDSIHRSYHHNALTFSLWYAFHENFVLAISHDEVVHGKGSMINKMAGDYWQKFANLRLFYTYMYTHPGKKLTFMGSDIAQWREWNHDQSLDWHLLDIEPHKKMNHFVRDLNHLYKNETALFTDDFTPDGFEWIDFRDNQQSIISYLRWAKDKKEFVANAFNFTPIPRENYRIGIPEAGKYKVIFNSDSEFYGGGNMGTSGVIEAEPTAWQNQNYSFEVTIPPLGAIIIKKVD